ncbi:MAG: hypothetical protein FWF53_05620 [Candidatus Azobacteroides sp.]|nr:hypothetical protein [Candidatus Azobacteroides sp.]
MSRKIKIRYDENNFNLHTDEGMELLEKSIRKAGVIESITVSSDEKIISGNARYEKIIEVLGDAEPIIIETDGTKPVILKRTDIKSGTKEFTEAAILANTTAKKNINLNTDSIREIAVEQFDINAEEIGVEVVGIDNYDNYNKDELPPEISGKDLTPDDLEKLTGDDNTLMNRIIITFPVEKQTELENMLGIKINKVIFSMNELRRQ